MSCREGEVALDHIYGRIESSEAPTSRRRRPDSLGCNRSPSIRGKQPRKRRSAPKLVAINSPARGRAIRHPTPMLHTRRQRSPTSPRRARRSTLHDKRSSADMEHRWRIAREEHAQRSRSDSIRFGDKSAQSTRNDDGRGDRW